MEHKARCAWVREDSALYCAYHDEEWGEPIHDETAMYGLFLLELFQAGLSWITLLKKREAFRAAFDGFDVKKIAAYDEEKIASLMQDAGIMACAKHFPGHGDVDVDSHYDLPVINKTREQLNEMELAPFQSIFKAGVWTGILIVIVVVALVIWLISKLFGGSK